MKNYKLVISVSCIIIAAFGILAISSLSPAPSREGAGDYISTAVPNQTTSSPSTTVEPNTSENTTPAPITAEPSKTASPEQTVYTLKPTNENLDFKFGSRTVATISFSIPKIVSNNNFEAVDRINTDLKSRANELIEGYSAECRQLVADYQDDMSEKYSYKATSAMWINNGMLSITVNVNISYGYSKEEAFFCFNYSAETGEVMKLDHIIKDKNALIDKAVEICDGMTDIEFSPGYATYIRTNICNEWYVKDNTIHLVYKPYEIASGIAGIIDIPISGDFLNI